MNKQTARGWCTGCGTVIDGDLRAHLKTCPGEAPEIVATGGAPISSGAREGEHTDACIINDGPCTCGLDELVHPAEFSCVQCGKVFANAQQRQNHEDNLRYVCAGPPRVGPVSVQQYFESRLRTLRAEALSQWEHLPAEQAQQAPAIHALFSGLRIRGGKDMPVDSPCGQDCARAISSAVELMRHVYSALRERESIERIARDVTDVCEVYING